MFTGSLVALVTPMSASQSGQPQVDFAALERLIDFHLEQGSDGLVVLGTTGESPTISLAERQQVVSLII
ncbi:MAG: dihydrodipicolinate synthase family protein, partial [Gammaproteobacteria bacterium]|nr:dihydrodipicolinate synthase family protein [Gammaproteobacteria bacterium]